MILGRDGKMIKVNPERCVGCGRCVGFCPTGALRTLWGFLEILPEKCNDCLQCVGNCSIDCLQLDRKGFDLPGNMIEGIKNGK